MIERSTEQYSLGRVDAAAGQSGRRYAVLSITAALVTIGFKLWAWLVTGSVGLLSDAAESFINLAAAIVALWALHFAARPPDDEHAYGHSKAEYFSSGLESALILVAALSIGATAWGRLQAPQPLENVGLGIAASLAATLVNGGVAAVLLRAGRRLNSIALSTGAHHLLTDVYTSIGIILAVLLVPLTGWLVLDPLIAFAVAANIVWAGVRLLRDTASGLLDRALPQEEQRIITRILSEHSERGIMFHAVRTRVAGQRRFVSLHVLVPGNWSVQRGHALCEEIEGEIIGALPKTTIFTHLEPLEDPASWQDQELDRLMSGR